MTADAHLEQQYLFFLCLFKRRSAFCTPVLHFLICRLIRLTPERSLISEISGLKFCSCIIFSSSGLSTVSIVFIISPFAIYARKSEKESLPIVTSAFFPSLIVKRRVLKDKMNLQSISVQCELNKPCHSKQYCTSAYNTS